MKWYQLTESNAPSMEELSDFIQNNCQPYIKENPDWKTKPLFRGIKEHEDVAIKTVRPDRKPVHTPNFLHTLYDYAFEEAGFKANRSNSMFCTGNYMVASMYGAMFVVLPIGNFSYTWSPVYEDLTYAVGNIINDGGIVFHNTDEDILTAEDIPMHGSEVRKYISYDFPKMFSYNYMIEKILPDLGLSPAAWVRRLKFPRTFNKLSLDNGILVEHMKKRYQSDNLKAAIASDNEIMINCERYLAIKRETFKQFVDLN